MGGASVSCSHRWLPILFFGAEVATWAMYFNWHNEGEDLTNKFEAFNRTHWSRDSYEQEYLLWAYGVTDDTARFQAVVDYVEATALVTNVNVSDGTYFLSATILIDTNGVRIKGQSKEGTIFTRSGNYGDTFLFTGDDSDGTFNIDNYEDSPVVTVTTPNGGEFFQVEDSIDITWTATDTDPGDVLTIDIYYSLTGIAPWTLISAGETNDELYPWNVPVDYTTTAKVRIVATDDSAGPETGEDISDDYFEIGSELLPMTVPLVEAGGSGISGSVYINSIRGTGG